MLMRFGILQQNQKSIENASLKAKVYRKCPCVFQKFFFKLNANDTAY